MRPWRVGRAIKPHDYASWLRGSLTAHLCADSELARIPSGHPAGLFCATSPPRNGIKIKGTQRSCAVRQFASDVFDVESRSCRPVVGGSAACGRREGSRGFDCQCRDALSVEPAHRWRTRTASPCGRQVRAAFFWFLFLAGKKRDSRAGRRTKRLTRPITGTKSYGWLNGQHE